MSMQTRRVTSRPWGVGCTVIVGMMALRTLPGCDAALGLGSLSERTADSGVRSALPDGSRGSTDGAGRGHDARVGTGTGKGIGMGTGAGTGTGVGTGPGTGTGTGVGAGTGVGGTDGGGAAGASVLQFHNHINRDGLFIDSAITEPSAANFGLDTSFAGTLSGNVYASPLYVERGVSGKGTFYVATEDGTVYALDEATGNVIWHKNVTPSPGNTGAGCGNIGPIGITGTPAIDLTTRLIVFDSPTADANSNIATHVIYALSIDTGVEAWHVDASTVSAAGVQFNPQPQNQRSAVLIVGGTAYVAYGGHYGDCGNYHGWVIGVPLNGQGAKGWATTIGRAGIWGVGGPASDGQSIFVTSGNGNSTSTWAGSEGMFRLGAGPTFSNATADYFAAYNWQSLDSSDIDLSGSGPLVIDAPSMTPSALLLAQGKDGNLYLVDRGNLGGVATMQQPANVGSLQVQSGEISNGAAWASVAGTTYVVVRPNGTQQGVGCPAGTSGDLVAVKLDPTTAEKMSVAWCADSQGVGSPSITSSGGGADALVWVSGAEGSGKLLAFELATGKPIFSGGTAADTAANVRRFTTPVAVHGRIFIGGDGQLFAYKAM